MEQIKARDGRDAVLIEFNGNGPRMDLSEAARTRTIYTPQYRLADYTHEDFGEFYSTAADAVIKIGSDTAVVFSY